MDFVKIQGYKSFKKIAVCLHPINLLIGANGAGKSNFLSLFEMLGNLYEKRLASYVAQMGGVNKFFYQGLKQTEKNRNRDRTEVKFLCFIFDGIRWKIIDSS